MLLNGLKIGFAFTGSFCTLNAAVLEFERVADSCAEIYPIVSEIVAATDTRFGSASEFLSRMEAASGRKVIKSITEAEPIGPKNLLDAIVIAPCTGNTLSKLAHGVTDSSVTMAAKACLRNHKPVIIAVSTNDGLSANGKNVGQLLNTKHVYFVPFKQDDPVSKSSSLISDLDMVIPAIQTALDGKQLQPVLL